jgi:hypothetical protein
MQLIREARGAFATAALVLLAGIARAQPPPEHAPPEPAPVVPGVAETTAPATSDTDVRASSEAGAYGDTDHVYVITPTVAGTVSRPTAGWSVGGRYLVDVVSAASVDIVSAASRRWTEVRHAGTLDGTYKPGAFGVGANAAVSSEPDYLSVTGGASIEQDIFDKHVTLLLGYSHGHDVAGRTGTPFSVFSRIMDRDALKLGSTFIVNRATVLSLVFDGIVESGDSSKPYRYVPMFAPGTDVPKGASVDQVTRLRVSYRPLEQLPLSRDRFAASARLAHRFDRTTIRAEERLYADTWALFASTTDLRILVDPTQRLELGPHLRLHAQKAVNFWQRAYVVGPGLDFPQLRTGDRELGPLVGLTLGGSLRVGVGPSERPSKWLLGLDLNLMTTQYLDDIYLTHRESGIVALSLQAEF